MTYLYVHETSDTKIKDNYSDVSSNTLPPLTGHGQQDESVIISLSHLVP